MKKLYRSRTDKMLAGVCGGIAEYLNIDSTIVRIVFVLFSLGGGFGILAYVALAIIMPERPYGNIEEPRRNADDFEREYRDFQASRKEKNEEDFY